MNPNRSPLLLVVAGGIYIVLMLGSSLFSRQRQPATGPALEAPVPMQEWTTADAGVFVMRSLPGSLPAPDPRQKGVACKESLGQFIINGACWQLLPVPPPCPREDGAFEHEDRKCYVRVLRAEKTPTSGGESRPGVANP